MKRKVCVRSMVLGAVIMLIGLAVGAIVSPPLIAQRDDVFGEIQCRMLTVLNKQGKPAVALASTEYGGRVDVFNNQGKNRATMQVNEYGNGAVSTWDRNGYRQ